MPNTKNIREVMNELLKSDRQATKTALLSYTDVQIAVKTSATPAIKMITRIKNGTLGLIAFEIMNNIRLLDKYTELSNKLTIIKNISSNWVASFVNRKAIRTLISKIREAKREINILISSYSSFRMNTNAISRIAGSVIITQVNK